MNFLIAVNVTRDEVSRLGSQFGVPPNQRQVEHLHRARTPQDDTKSPGGC